MIVRLAPRVASINEQLTRWTKSMDYNIRPLSFGEILDRALRILVDNAVLLIGISAAYGIPESALAVLGRSYQLVLVLVALSAGPLIQAALTTAIADTYLGRPVTIVSAYKSAWSIILPIFGTYLLAYLLFGLGGAVLGAIGVISGVTHSKALAWAFILVILAAVPLMVYLMIRWSLMGPIMIVERRFGLSTIRRSGDLVEGVWWRTFGIIMVAAVIVRIPLSALNFLWSSVPVVGIVLGGLTTSIAYAYGAVALVVYYFDRRCRTEDFDLRLLAEQIRTEGAQGGPAMTGAPSLG